jgi:membrane protein implicated in regulation of membrane protease activity
MVVGGGRGHTGLDAYYLSSNEMIGLYLFSLAVGAPLLLWMVFVGDSDGGDGFGLDAGGDGSMTVIPLSALAGALAAFGGIGVIGGTTNTGFVVTLVFALTLALVIGYGSHRLFKWVKAPGASSEVTDAELEGSIARVSLPISDEFRGKIIVDIAGAREQLTASPADGSTLLVGEPVVIVRIEGGVALVAPLDPGLELD